VNWYRNIIKQTQTVTPQVPGPPMPGMGQASSGNPEARYRFIGIFETRVENTNQSPQEFEAAQRNVEEFRQTLEGPELNTGDISVVSIDPPEWYAVGGAQVL